MSKTHIHACSRATHPAHTFIFCIRLLYHSFFQCGNFFFHRVRVKNLACAHTRNIPTLFGSVSLTPFIHAPSVCDRVYVCGENFNLKTMQQRTTHPPSIEIYHILTTHRGIVPRAHNALVKSDSSNFKAYIIVLHVAYSRHLCGCACAIRWMFAWLTYTLSILQHLHNFKLTNL